MKYKKRLQILEALNIKDKHPNINKFIRNLVTKMLIIFNE